MKKLAVTDKGKGWAGVTIRDPALLAVAERFVRATHWRGACEIEVIRAADGTYYLIEVNPRFPAWTYLATCAGMNLPWRAVEVAAGGSVHASMEYEVSKVFVRISLDQITDMSVLAQLFTNGELSLSHENTLREQPFGDHVSGGSALPEAAREQGPEGELS